MARQEKDSCSKGALFKAPLAFVSALAVVFLFPSAASKIKSWQDCSGFNLMFLSALPGAVLAVVTSINGATNVQKKKRGFSCCDNFGFDCLYCFCDGCGVFCSEGCKCCCEGCCDHCNCCDGCGCDGCGCDCCGCDGCDCGS